MHYLGRNVFFTADHHFGHENIIGFTQRPFANSKEMDKALIGRWNDVVPKDGTVFHLGDFTLDGPRRAAELFAQLNGQIYVLANPWHHDFRWLIGSNRPHFRSRSGQTVMMLPPLVVLEAPIIGEEWPLVISLCHYPLATWDRKHYGAWHLFGHEHGPIRTSDGLCLDRNTNAQNALALDVGVDVPEWRYAPVSLQTIAETMYQRGAKLPVHPDYFANITVGGFLAASTFDAEEHAARETAA